MYRDKFIIGLNNDTMRAELLKTHLKPDNTPNSMADVVTKAKALESAYTANKLITDSSKSTTEERVHWVKHKEMNYKESLEHATGVETNGDLTHGDNAQHRAKHVSRTTSPMCAWQMANHHNDGDVQ